MICYCVWAVFCIWCAWCYVYVMCYVALLWGGWVSVLFSGVYVLVCCFGGVCVVFVVLVVSFDLSSLVCTSLVWGDCGFVLLLVGLMLFLLFG